MRRWAVLALALVLVPAASSRPAGSKIQVPYGFRVETFARGLFQPTAMAWGLDRRLYVTETNGRIMVLRPGRSPRLFARGFSTPLGLAWRGHTLYVSEQGRVETLRLRARGGLVRRTLVAGLPYGRHQQDTIVFGRDGRLYLGSGSTCDVCRERDRRSAAVLSMRPDGSDLRVVATGMRNPFGLAFQPGTHRLYASVNGQDFLGTKNDPEPAETVVVVRKGRWYGWPTCWPSAHRLRLVGECKGATAPAAYLSPHSSADGLAFWRRDLYVAEWGQYNSNRFGRLVMRIQLDRRGHAGRVSVFASGFDHPLALAVDRRGALLVADWGRGVIYRIQSLGGA
jgi:glucose/arabinose dehydrogenase